MRAEADSDGEIRERVQTNGRCESANERGDTYGPVAYEAYVPGVRARSGGAASGTSCRPRTRRRSLFDLLALLGLVLVGRRFGGARLAVMLPFAWAAYPFTQYVSSSNTNDAIMPVLLIFGFWLVTSAFGRGAFLALAGWTKFAALLLVPLWAGYPEGRRSPERRLLQEVLSSLRSPRSRSCSSSRTRRTRPGSSGTGRSAGRWAAIRRSRSGAGASTTRPGSRTSASASRSSIGLLAVGAVACYFVPRRKTPLQLAALTAALLIGFELTLTHWFYLYIPWFFPFVAFVVLAPAGGGRGASAR